MSEKQTLASLTSTTRFANGILSAIARKAAAIRESRHSPLLLSSSFNTVPIRLPKLIAVMLLIFSWGEYTMNNQCKIIIFTPSKRFSPYLIEVQFRFLYIEPRTGIVVELEMSCFLRLKWDLELRWDFSLSGKQEEGRPRKKLGLTFL